MSNKAVTVYAKALKRQQQEQKQQVMGKATPRVTRKATRRPTRASEPSRELSRDRPRGKPRSLPTRDESQEFSFRLRDQLKVKVQAEVPHQWHKELEETARRLNVKKLELYRFILGEFLGKVRRKGTA